MSWREPIANDDEPDPIKELLRPKTLNDHWQDFVDTQIEQGADPEGFADLTFT